MKGADSSNRTFSIDCIWILAVTQNFDAVDCYFPLALQKRSA